jgi:hypothetical protein
LQPLVQLDLAQTLLGVMAQVQQAERAANEPTGRGIAVSRVCSDVSGLALLVSSLVDVLAQVGHSILLAESEVHT